MHDLYLNYLEKV